MLTLKLDDQELDFVSLDPSAWVSGKLSIMCAAVYRAFKQFLKTTTLHGFKYLASPIYLDRFGWLFCCCASACCAGVLCTVLWARFQQVPAVLALSSSQDVQAPLVAVCATPERTAQHFAKNFLSTTNYTNTINLTETFKLLLKNKKMPETSLLFLERILMSHDISLSDALMNVTPSCREIVKKCRWRNRMEPCEDLFEKTHTEWGICCIAWADRLSTTNYTNTINLTETFKLLLKNKKMPETSLLFLERILMSHDISLSDALMNVTPSCREIVKKCRWRNRMEPCEDLFEKTHTEWGICCIAWADRLNGLEVLDPLPANPRLDLLLHCSDGSLKNGCEFYTRYSGEEWITPVPLTVGYTYNALVAFQLVKETSKEKLIDGDCVSDSYYSKRQCLDQCKERKCGCSNPMRHIKSYERNALPACPMSKLNCLRSFRLLEPSCACPAACKKVTVITTFEPSAMTEIQHTFDPIFKKANVSTDNSIKIRLLNSGSKVFDLMYSETWWSLLSSLGGVFSMFLGVGLFSALEFLFLIFAELPIALWRSSELKSNTARTPL